MSDNLILVTLVGLERSMRERTNGRKRVQFSLMYITYAFAYAQKGMGAEKSNSVISL